MKKALKYIRLIVLILFANLAEYIFLPLPYTIFNIRLFQISGAAALHIAVKSVLFTALNVFLCTYLLSACRAKKKYCLSAFNIFKKSILISLIARVIFDAAAWLLNEALYEFDFPIYFVLDTAFLIVVFGIVNRKIKKSADSEVKASRNKFGKIQVCIAVIAFCAASVTFIFASMHYLDLMAIYTEKYTDYSVAMRLSATAQGKINILNVLINCILWISLWHIFGVSKMFAGDTDKPTAKYVIRSVKKSACVVAAAAIFGVLNFFFFPTDMIYHFESVDVPEKSVTDAGNFSVKQSNFAVSRTDVSMLGSGIYQSTKVKIAHGNDPVLKFRTDNYDNTYGIDVDFEACRYGCQAIAWEEDNSVKAILAKNIRKSKENRHLTDMLEKLISQGELEFFEYGYEYLLEYDKDFITPYFSRYSAGKFNEAELNNSSSVNSQYIQKLAQKAQP